MMNTFLETHRNIEDIVPILFLQTHRNIEDIVPILFLQTHRNIEDIVPIRSSLWFYVFAEKYRHYVLYVPMCFQKRMYFILLKRMLEFYHYSAQPTIFADAQPSPPQYPALDRAISNR
jgi:hypothetical protein